MSLHFLITKENNEKGTFFGKKMFFSEYSASNEPLIPLLRATLSGN